MAGHPASGVCNAASGSFPGTSGACPEGPGEALLPAVPAPVRAAAPAAAPGSLFP
ncbi:MAG: hypothetical protein LBK99_27690 [Opitutaceae bacterium]|nr:hypothetical protein [Opitutaceae bacterium]